MVWRSLLRAPWAGRTNETHRTARITQPALQCRWRSGSAGASRRPREPRASTKAKREWRPRGKQGALKLQLPRPTSDAEILRRLRDEVGEFSRRSSTSEQLVGFGLGRRAARASLSMVPSGTHEAADIDRRTVIEVTQRTKSDKAFGLLLRCWEAHVGDSLASVGAYASTDRLFGDLHALSIDYDAEGNGALTRACMNSFLTWIDPLLMQASVADCAAATPQTVEEVRSTLTQLRLLREATDLRTPSFSYAAARTLTRQVYLHVGPTNSGKTHGALLALARARTGMYAGPLRLLAHEVWERLNGGTISQWKVQGKVGGYTK